MFLYCITPYGRLVCNFIKVGICKDITTLKSRYITYYGNNCIYYYVKVKHKTDEKNIHEILKNLGLHLENELFILNKDHNFYFYVNILKKFNLTIFKDDKFLKEDIYILKRNHVLDFIIYIYEKDVNSDNKNIIFYYKKEDMEYIWNVYLKFCIDINQYINDKNIFRKYLKTMKYCDNPIKKKNYEIYFKTEKIIVNDLNIIENKYTRCKNKIKILLLYEYIKVRKKILRKRINYMINVPLHEDIIQKIAQNNSKRYIVEYRFLCYIINKEIIDKYKNYFEYKPKIKHDINRYTDYNTNKNCNKNEIINIVINIKNLTFILKKNMEIHYIEKCLNFYVFIKKTNFMV